MEKMPQTTVGFLRNEEQSSKEQSCDMLLEG